MPTGPFAVRHLRAATYWRSPPVRTSAAAAAAAQEEVALRVEATPTLR